MKLLVLSLTPTATVPWRVEPGSVGYDLSADLGGPGGFVKIPAGERSVIGTGLAFAIPDGMYGRVAPRSGLAVKHGIDVLAGVVDPSYRGEVKIALLNTDAGKAFTVYHGDRVAQLILERCEVPDVVEVDSLDDTARGAGGFGSTGVA